MKRGRLMGLLLGAVGLVIIAAYAVHVRNLQAEERRVRECEAERARWAEWARTDPAPRETFERWRRECGQDEQEPDPRTATGLREIAAEDARLRTADREIEERWKPALRAVYQSPEDGAEELWLEDFGRWIKTFRRRGRAHLLLAFNSPVEAYRLNDALNILPTPAERVRAIRRYYRIFTSIADWHWTMGGVLENAAQCDLYVGEGVWRLERRPGMCQASRAVLRECLEAWKQERCESEMSNLARSSTYWADRDRRYYAEHIRKGAVMWKKFLDQKYLDFLDGTRHILGHEPKWSPVKTPAGS